LFEFNEFLKFIDKHYQTLKNESKVLKAVGVVIKLQICESLKYS